jgi:hypothetical protein
LNPTINFAAELPLPLLRCRFAVATDTEDASRAADLQFQFTHRWMSSALTSAKSFPVASDCIERLCRGLLGLGDDALSPSLLKDLKLMMVVVCPPPLAFSTVDIEHVARACDVLDKVATAKGTLFEVFHAFPPLRGKFHMQIMQAQEGLDDAASWLSLVRSGREWLTKYIETPKDMKLQPFAKGLDLHLSPYFEKEQLRNLFRDALPAEEKDMDALMVSLASHVKEVADDVVYELAAAIAEGRYDLEAASTDEALQFLEKFCTAVADEEAGARVAASRAWWKHFRAKSFADSAAGAADIESTRDMLRMVEDLLKMAKVSVMPAEVVQKYRETYHPELMKGLKGLCEGPRKVVDDIAILCKALIAEMEKAFQIEHVNGVPDDLTQSMELAAKKVGGGADSA